MALSDKQIRLFHVRARERGLDVEAWHKLVLNVTGKDSLTLLDNDELNAVFERMGYTSNRRLGATHHAARRRGREAVERKAWGAGPKRNPGGGGDPITVDQQRLIGELCDQMEMPVAVRQAVSERVCKTPWPQTNRDGQKLIEALRAMSRRGWKPTAPEAA